ncbi:MAG: T9SS type A sorting domain-containing protein, partial [Bacteroidia bacterium]|nr:T9SS type A sorting domain-containing protein [Bacteroidia bacterium]
PVLALDVQEGTSSGRFFLHLGEAVSGVDERMANRMFSIFPNPADDVLSLQWNAEGREQAEQVSVHDATGRLVMQMDASAISSGSRMNLPVKLLAAGAYQVSLSTKNGRYTRTFIVRH